MKKVIALLLVLVVSAGFAIAADKPLDTEEYSIQNPGRLVINGVLSESSPLWDRGVDFSAPPAPNCDFPFADHSSDATRYDQHCFQVTDTSPVEMEVVDPTTVSDTTIYIFCAGFDGAFPLDEGVFWDDDGGVGLRSAFTLDDNIVLTPGVDYWLVVSTYWHTTTLGDYTIQTGDNITLCGSVATEASNWSSVKGLFR